jgi:hypothetical protein
VSGLLVLAFVIGPAIGFIVMMTAIGSIAVDWRRPVSRA